jgi:chorismate dehydratase
MHIIDRRIRVGAINYLNTTPLIYDLEWLAPEIELVLDLPGRLADLLGAGRLDVALIPTIEFLRHGGYTLLRDVAIASRGPVMSVTLFSHVPWHGIRRLAIDVGSRTSAALAHIMLHKRHGVRPETVPLPLDCTAEDVDADAILLIGDRAMRACLPGFAYAFDLGQEWHDWTGLPFVYAVWAVRPGAGLRGVAEAIQKAKRRGCAQIGEIASQEASRRGLNAGFCRRYLANVLHYDLGVRELAGLRRFSALAVELGIVTRRVGLEYHSAEELQGV